MATNTYTDLSDRMGPMTVKELRQGLRRSSFVYPFLGIHLLATVAIFFEFQLGIGSSDAGKTAVLFWNPDRITPFWWVAMGVCGLLMPFAGFFLMPQELEEGNHEILLLSKLSRTHIVLGKFFTLLGLSLLTLVSLLPYVIIRYFIGGVEWLDELAKGGTVFCTAALITASAIAASGFRHLAAKFGIFILMILASASGGGLSMISPIVLLSISEGSNWEILAYVFHHVCAFLMVASYSILGLMVARSKLRLAMMNYEIRPSSVLIYLIVLSPFVIGIIAMFTLGFGSIVGILLMVFLAWNSDRTPKAPKWLPAPAANIPPPLPAKIPLDTPEEI